MRSRLLTFGTLILAAIALAAQPLVVTSDTTLATTLTYDYIQVSGGAVLTFADGADVTLTGKDGSGRSVWASGSGTAIQFGTSGTPIGIADQVRLRLTDSSRMVLMGGASLYAYGPDTNLLQPYTRLETDIAAGDSVFDVSNATGWQVGDSIGVTSTTIGPWECERRAIVAISNTTVTVSPPFWYDHDGTSDSIRLQRLDTAGNVAATKYVDARAYVAHLTRPIQIYTVGESYTATGADIMVMVGGRASATGLELRRLGMALPDSVPYNGGPTTASYSGDQLPGRYALHWHLCDSTGDVVRNCVGLRSRNKTFNVHGTGYVTLRWNVTWHGFNHQFVIGEDGIESERGIVVTDNLAAYTRRVINTSEPWDEPPGNEVAFPNSTGSISNNRIPGVSYQAETHPGAFMIWTPGCVLKRNIAACGTASVGFYFQAFMGRRIGIHSQDTLVLPGDFDFSDQIDSTLTLVDTPTFVGNIAFGFYPECNRTTGVIGDVCQDPFQTGASRSSNGYLSYRANGGGFWQSHGSTHMERDRIAWVVRDFVVYNCAYGIWNEYENQRFLNVWAFHNRYGANLLGGQMEDCFFADSNYTGNLMALALAYSTASNNGYIDPSGNDLYQGYQGIANTTKRDYTDMGYPAISVYNKDRSNGARPARRPITLHRVHAHNYPSTFSVLSNFEGPVYVDELYNTGGDTTLIVDWTTSPSDDGGTTAGWWDFKGTEGQASANLTDSTRNALGAWDGLVFDITGNRMIWANGQQIDTCGGWMVLRLDDTKKVNVFDNPPSTSGLPAASIEPWYTTRSGYLPGPFDYPQRTLPRVSKQAYSATAIVPTGTTMDSPAVAFRVRAYGCREGESVTIGGQSVSYQTAGQPDLLNVAYLRGEEASSTAPFQNRRPTQLRPKLRLLNPAGVRATVTLSGATDSIDRDLFGINQQGYFQGVRSIPQFTAQPLVGLLDSISVYGSRQGGTVSWVNWNDYSNDTALGYGYRITLGASGDQVQSASAVAQDQNFPHNNAFQWMRTITDTVPKLSARFVYTPQPHLAGDTGLIGGWIRQMDSAGILPYVAEIVNEPYSQKIGRAPWPANGGGMNYGRWHPFGVDSVVPMLTARGITNTCAHLPPSTYLVLDSANWTAGVARHAAWRDSAKAAYAGTLAGFSQFKPPCAIVHQYRIGTFACETVSRGVTYDCACTMAALVDSPYYEQLQVVAQAMGDAFSDGSDTARIYLTEFGPENQADGLANSWAFGASVLEIYLAIFRFNAERGGLIEGANFQILSSPRTQTGNFFSGLIDLGKRAGEIQGGTAYEALKAFQGLDSGGVFLPLSSYTFPGLGDSLRLGLVRSPSRTTLAWVNYAKRPVQINAIGSRTVAWQLLATGGTPNRYLRETNGQCLYQGVRRTSIRGAHGRTSLPPQSYGFIRNVVLQ